MTELFFGAIKTALVDSWLPENSLDACNADRSVLFFPAASRTLKSKKYFLLNPYCDQISDFITLMTCFQNWDFIKNLQRRICKSSVPKMTTSIYTHFILSKMSLRERLIFELLFRERALLVLRLDFFSTSQLFSNCFCSNIFCKCFEFFSSTDNFSNLWSSNFKQICSDSFRSWDYMFFNKGKCSSPKSLCKHPSTLSCMSMKTGKIATISYEV